CRAARVALGLRSAGTTRVATNALHVHRCIAATFLLSLVIPTCCSGRRGGTAFAHLRAREVNAPTLRAGGQNAHDARTENRHRLAESPRGRAGSCGLQRSDEPQHGATPPELLGRRR